MESATKLLQPASVCVRDSVNVSVLLQERSWCFGGAGLQLAYPGDCPKSTESELSTCQGKASGWRHFEHNQKREKEFRRGRYLIDKSIATFVSRSAHVQHRFRPLLLSFLVFFSLPSAGSSLQYSCELDKGHLLI